MLVINSVDKQRGWVTRWSNTHILSGICAHRGWAGRSAHRIAPVGSVERSNNRG